jgi:hypothetical protein
MSDFLMDIGKVWLEWVGRQKPAPRYTFQENEIVSPGYPKDVSDLWKATYLRLHPTHYAVAISPDGRVINLQGGYNVLPPGLYNIHYVDRQNRVNNLPRTSETTTDGFHVAMELVISYRVIDPIKALEVQNPVDTLLRLVQANVKEFIRSHKYDEIVGDLDGHKIDNDQVVSYIKEQQISRSPLARLFNILDLVVKEKIGDPKVIELREKYQISQRQLDNQRVLQTQNQELEKKVADQDALIKQIKAMSAVDQQNILQKMEMQKIELEKARADFQYRQENWGKAVDAIVQTLSNQTYPPDSAEYEVIKELLMELRASTYPNGEASRTKSDKSANPPVKASNPDRINELTRTLLNWRRPTPPA